MNRILSFFIAAFFAVPAASCVLLLSYFVLDATFMASMGLFLAAGAAAAGATLLAIRYNFLKKQGISLKEYRYIKKNLNEAKHKIFRLNKALVLSRHLPSFKKRLELIRITRKIYSLTNKEPKRFYLADEFYFSHLDSILELSEKYNFLSSQPKRNFEIEASLAETRHMMDELGLTIEKDLYQMISGDMDQLHFEIDVAKKSIQTAGETP
ncbi:5-bromo-4-chloroindolyl phosphate hydrolysis family protein [Peribacillus sp. SCS-26]|uniref:5-bromo-4-chloroindolyl phosphate hydrolysis family protein n=1 Tax=Paraperibacillus marinus TaxID=3115295 RepID=UPI0039060DFE